MSISRAKGLNFVAFLVAVFIGIRTTSFWSERCRSLQYSCFCCLFFELHDLYPAPDVTGRSVVVLMRQTAYRIVVGQRQRERLHRRSRRRWEDKIKMDREQDGRAWITLVRIVLGSCKRGNELSSSARCVSSVAEELFTS